MNNEGDSEILEVQSRIVHSIPVVAASGEIDIVSAPLLKSALDEAVQADPSMLIVDLSGITFLGSVGLSVLIALRESTTIELQIVVSQQARRPIEVTGMAEFFTLTESLEDALPQI
ncbi:STAS domain-containing protein [Nocardia jejuensis]|uniref:STAS domain-containing protein n=1 Tax=Nocardia jejuensis TaxID=328049 RepID=UPI000831FE07|nr:STAS domain-containing protein [Nocardia jejuensis]